MSIESEIGVLRKVIVHAPGPEVEAMTPGEAAQDLYNDIVPLGAVRGEHDRLRSFLAKVAEVYELEVLLAQCLEQAEARFEFLGVLSGFCPIGDRIDALMDLPSPVLAKLVIEGLPASEDSLSHLLSPRSFSLRPLPNTYFMRDTAAVFRDFALSSAMAYDVRVVESLVTRFVLTRHHELRAHALLLDGPRDRNRFVTMEGGDFIVISRNVLAIGVSERTSPDAIELFARTAAPAIDEALTIFAVVLPKERATIHLDMVFTVIDRDRALVHGPTITGPSRRPVFRIDVSPSGALSTRPVPGLLEGLAEAGHDFEPVACGGGDPLYEEREQWLSGANSFAFAPGKILMYSCNLKTIAALSDAGFAIRKAEDFIEGRESVADFGRLVVAFDGIELARGGGGARCMTMPLERDEL
ncbi:MAG TPA: arginine deiminase family protein [Rectinemataceae bacterium]|nr:arginine deiminase family protein [Rectinemataceae bacterium]